jgi:hypothetical protein
MPTLPLVPLASPAILPGSISRNANDTMDFDEDPDRYLDPGYVPSM